MGRITEDAESSKARGEFRNSVRFESDDSYFTCALDVDRGVVEERDSVRRNPEVADHVFVDCSFRFDMTNLVREKEVLDDGSEALSVERGVEFVGIAQSGDSGGAPKEIEKGNRTGVGLMRPFDEFNEEFRGREIDPQLLDDAFGESLRGDLAPFEGLHRCRVDPAIANFGSIWRTGNQIAQLFETGKIHQDPAEVKEENVETWLPGHFILPKNEFVHRLWTGEKGRFEPIPFPIPFPKSGHPGTGSGTGSGSIWCSESLDGALVAVMIAAATARLHKLYTDPTFFP